MKAVLFSIGEVFGRPKLAREPFWIMAALRIRQVCGRPEK